MTPCYLFVYGTLRPDADHPMSRFLARRSRLRGAATVAGRLYDLGRYPALVEATTDEERVRGSLSELFDAEDTLAALDRYEGVATEGTEGLFERTRAAVRRETGEVVEAFVYVYRGPVSEGQRVASGDWLERRPLQE
jgi:gamma-glutamylcyclotransferase (GGCT)/AIG2-like uncharacterized protein YtfP